MSNSGPGFMTGTSIGNLDLMCSLRRGRDFYWGLGLHQTALWIFFSPASTLFALKVPTHGHDATQ